MLKLQVRNFLALAALICLLGQSRAVKNVISMSVSVQDKVHNGGINSEIKKVPKPGQTFAFAKHFQNNMVLQKAPARASIYGFSSEIGQKVIAQMRTPSHQYYYSTTVQQGPSPDIGVWSFSLDPIDANITVSISVQSEIGLLAITNVIFGDVWLCSGQSNMQLTVIMMLNASQELADATNYPNVRIMTVAEEQSDTPLHDLISIQEDWTSPSSATIGGPAWTYFSAVCWLYGKYIHKELGYPIGLVATDWGGTPVEAWSSPEALAECGVTSTDNTARQQPPGYQSYVDQLPPAERAKLTGPLSNSVLWNAMVTPLLGMTIYGAIWYQGENDASGAMMNRYNCTFPTMIKDWRKNFNKFSNGQTSALFPFGFVQLAPNRDDPTISVGFPDIRFHQTADWGYVPNRDMPNVFMAVAMDLPDFNSTYGSIHPRDKIDVGLRLSLSGLAVAYGKQEVFQGPFPVRGEVYSDHLLLEYGNSANLQIRDTEGFELLCVNGAAKKWVPATIIAYNKTAITLNSNVCNPGQQLLGLRYAWRESPCAFKKCAVYETVNSLPAPPFVTIISGATYEKLQFRFDGPMHY
ncbi:unnamed protein product [Candidula unifasciata]|uniref:Sialate O-acetylesterase domain-containing protein n=1 Tax=Candidula unifasciata TaxID=100452 RepID=A0A8S3ZR91_9EUPU|nr:unnamed protein product [Candidula unifasciata]